MSSNCLDNLNKTIDEVIDFYRQQQKVVDLWQFDDNKKNKDNEDTAINSFFILKGNILPVNNEDEVRKRLQLIEVQAEMLRDEIGDILDDNQDQVNESVITALDMIYGYIERFAKVYIDKSHKFLKSEMESEELDVKKKIEEFYDLLVKTFKVIFEEALSAIYRGMKIDNNPLYEIVLSSINNFLKNVGIYTLDLKIGEKINVDICSYADETVAKETENIELDDVIYEIKQYPYFIDDFLLSTGKACAWRFVR